MEKPMPKHIEAAIEKCSEINQNPRRWAILEVVPTQYRAIARVDWGHIRFDGRREVAIQTLTFDITKDGKVTVSEHTHS